MTGRLLMRAKNPAEPGSKRVHSSTEEAQLDNLRKAGLPSAGHWHSSGPLRRNRLAQKKPGGDPAAAAAPAASRRSSSRSTRSPNGLQVILHVDRKLPMVHVNQWYHVGVQERAGRAHRLRAPLRAHDVPGLEERRRRTTSPTSRSSAPTVQEGGVNGTTNQDRTNYFATVPSANLETILWLESDRLATLAEAMTKEKLDNQRDVVKNERRQGLENTPVRPLVQARPRRTSIPPGTRTRGP